MADIPVPVTTGWSPTTTVAAVQLIATVLLGGGGVYGIARGIALLWKMANDRAKQDNDAAAAVRREMMELNDRQQKRIDDLERQAGDERKRHADEMSALRHYYEGKLVALQNQVSALTHQLFIMQQGTGKPIVLTPAKGKLATDDLAETLKAAFPPIEGDEL